MIGVTAPASALLFLLLAGTVGAAPSIEWQLGSDPEFRGEAEALLSQGGLQTSDGFVHVSRHVDIKISDNAVTERVRQVYYYGDTAAIQNYGYDTVYWDSSREHVRFLEAAALTSDGQWSSFNPETVNINDSDSYDVFTDQREIVLQLPGLAPGSVSILSFERQITDGDPYFFREYLQTANPRRSVSIAFEWDNAAPPRWHMDEGIFECEESESRVVCAAEDIPAALTDEVVYYADVLPQLVIASDRSWQDVIDKTLADVRWATEGSTMLDGISAKLQGNGNPVADMQHFVSQQIRYVSFSQAEHSVLPHKIDLTLENRYGDCKDKSALLLALLNDAGVEAYPVLVATKRENPDKLKVPATGYFDHMVVCMKVDNGERCLDPTDSYADAFTTPSWIQGSVRLNLLDGATPTKVPASRNRWQFNVESDLTFDAEGGQVDRTRVDYLHEYGAWVRQALNGRDASDREEWLTEIYQEAVAESAEPEFSLESLQDLDTPLVVHFEASYPPYIEVGESTMIIEYSYWLRNFISNQYVQNEHYGHQFEGVRVNSTSRIDPGDSWVLAQQGPDIEFESPFGEMTRRYTVKDGQLEVTTFVDIPERWVPIEELEAFNRFLELVWDETRINFWMDPAGDS